MLCPMAFIIQLKEKSFYLSSGTSSEVESGRDYFCIVKNKAITGTNIFCDIAEITVSKSVLPAIDNQQSGRCAVRQALLSDQFFRQIVIEIICLHGQEIIRRLESGKDNIGKIVSK